MSAKNHGAAHLRPIERFKDEQRWCPRDFSPFSRQVDSATYSRRQISICYHSTLMLLTYSHAFKVD
jgi:hypothetical protein